MAKMAATVKLKEIYPNPGSKTKSDVWKVFGFYKIKDDEPPTRQNLDTTNAVCRLCRKTYKNTGNTTNFRQHIDGEHKLPSEKSRPSYPVPKAETKLVQPTISSTLTKGSGTISGSAGLSILSQERRARIDDALYKLIVGKVLPPSLVENEHFINFLKELDPR